jgi:PAS domain S-box-containing protein
MAMQIRKIVIAFSGIYLVCACQVSFCQPLLFDHYAVEHGISQSEIICIFQDSEGYMWFGTQNGLNKFDGYTFEQFFHNPSDSNTISNSWIFDIEEDAEGFLWIATKGGLNKYDKRSDRFIKVGLSGRHVSTEDDFVYGLTVDANDLYISQPPVLTVMDLHTGKAESFNNDYEHDGALYDIGFPIIKDSRGLLWIGSMHGLASFDLQEKVFTNYRSNSTDPSSISHDHITALYEDGDGNLLIGTENGLNLYNPTSKIMSTYFQASNDPHSLSHDYIHAIIQDHTGTVWIGTDGGLNKMSNLESTGRVAFYHFRSGPDRRNYISHDIVYSLYEDNSNNLWIGTIAGINKTDLKKKSIRTYNKSDSPNSVDLLDNVIASVHQAKDRRLWIGTWGKGLNILDRKTGMVTHYTTESSGRYHIPQNHVHVIFEDSRSRMWLGTRNGVSILDTNRQLFVPVQDYFGKPELQYFRNNRVYCMIEDSRGEFWFGTGNGICILNVREKTARILRVDSDNALRLSSNLVYSLLEDQEKHIWIATSNGLDQYVPAENRMYHYLNDPGSENTLCDNYTISLCEDRYGALWIGTSSGVNRFDKVDSVFTHFSLRNGLPSNIIYDIIEDARGHLWFSTGNGLATINPTDLAKKSFQVEDELRGREFNIKAVFRGDDGEMFFGGIDGLISFYPDSLTDNAYVPPVRITSLEKENDGIRQRMNVYAEEVVLSYRDYSFTIEFSALDFTNPSKNRYAYRMEGIADRWVEIGTRRFVPFTNLPPGHYTFHVRGTNNDGVWNLEGSTCRITILPPWWRSNLAYVLYLLLTAMLVVLVIKIRERNLVREKKVLEEKISERTREIAQQKEKVEESESKLKSTISSIDDLVFVLDRGGVFQEFYKPEKYTSLYREPAFYIGKCFDEVGLPEPAVQQLRMALKALRQEKTVEEFDYCIEQDGEISWFNAKFSQRRNTQGELSGITVVARDITERKRSEEQLKELNATKDTFFSILAHDLKNPFSSLHSMSELVIQEYPNLKEEEKLKVLGNIHKSAELIFNLLENLLTWSKSQRGKIEYSPSKFSLTRLVEVNLNLHQVPAEKKGIKLTSNAPEEIYAYGDREMINTVIRNLINNAVKFSRKGGSIEVGIATRDEMLEVVVSDQGVGIPEENVNKIFRIDQQFKSPGTAGETGTGLGLVLCRDFVEKNGGKIWCQTREGSGSSFYFTVPGFQP